MVSAAPIISLFTITFSSTRPSLRVRPLIANSLLLVSTMNNDPFLSLPIHAPEDKDLQGGFKYKHSLSAGIIPFQSNQQHVITSIEAQRLLRNLSSRSGYNQYNSNIMSKNDGGIQNQCVNPSAGDQDDLTASVNSIISTSTRSASPDSETNSQISPSVAIAAAMNRKNRQKNDKAVEVLNSDMVVVARFRTQTDCAKYLLSTPEAVSYHCSRKGGGICNGLIVRPCDCSDDDDFGLFKGSEEARPKRRPQLKSDTVAILKQWLLSPEHIHNPYPTPEEFDTLQDQTQMSKTQLKHWFNNARKRILKPILAKKGISSSLTKPVQRQAVQEKRKAAPEYDNMKRASKKVKASSTTGSTDAAVSQFGIMFGSERAGAGALSTMSNENFMAMGIKHTPMLTRFNQNGSAKDVTRLSGNPSSISTRSTMSQANQQLIEPSPVVFKQQVASMAMKEATIAFKNMEDAYAMAKEIMAIVSSSGSTTNIEEDPRVIDATNRAKKLQSVALFKLKVSKRASEEAEKAFEMMSKGLA